MLVIQKYIGSVFSSGITFFHILQRFFPMQTAPFYALCRTFVLRRYIGITQCYKTFWGKKFSILMICHILYGLIHHQKTTYCFLDGSHCRSKKNKFSPFLSIQTVIRKFNSGHRTHCVSEKCTLTKTFYFLWTKLRGCSYLRLKNIHLHLLQFLWT